MARLPQPPGELRAGSAYGLYADDSITTGAINGTITATMTHGSDAYGMYAGNNLTVGSVGYYGEISATTGQNDAVGVGSGGTLNIGAMGGEIYAHADGNFAYGILAYGPMNVTIDGGYVGATAGGGKNVAAIQSGKIYGGALVTQNADDMVNIAAGSVIDGNIDLGGNGTDHDVLTCMATLGIALFSTTI